MSRPNKGLGADKSNQPTTSMQLHTGQLIHLIEALATEEGRKEGGREREKRDDHMAERTVAG